MAWISSGNDISRPDSNSHSSDSLMSMLDEKTVVCATGVAAPDSACGRSSVDAEGDDDDDDNDDDDDDDDDEEEEEEEEADEDEAHLGCLLCL